MARKKRGFGGWLAGPGKYLVGLVVIAAIGWYWYARDEAEAARPAYRVAKVLRGTVASTVNASGTLKALISVDVGTQISGQIKQLFADYNTEVKAGQVIARLDPASFEAKVREAEADLATAKSNVVLMKARLDSMRSDTAQAKSAMSLAKLDLDRKRELLPSKAISRSTYDQAAAAHDQAVARYKGTLAKEAEQRATIDVAVAQVQQKEATLTQRRIDLENTYIRSPVDGVVIARNVNVGQTVAASLQSPVLFTIAQDLKQMQVEVNVDEADIGRIREGQVADFTVDSFPGHTFPGKVRQVRMAPVETSNVITYTVVVSTQNPDLRLLPGMTANVVFEIQRRDDAILLPNAALRFHPAGERNPGEPGERSRHAEAHASAAAGHQQGRQRLERRIAQLKRTLALTDEQEQKIRAIYREMGQRQRQMRASDTPFDERRDQMAKMRRTIEDRIAALLTPEQKSAFEALRSTLSDAGRRRATVYVVGPAGKPKPLRVLIGITDGRNTVLVQGDIDAGDAVIIGQDAHGSAAAGRRRRHFGL
jgi:HlyD family secretion protein